MGSFDPDDAARPGSGIFGLPHGPEDARVHILPVPFHATTSYRRGAALGPRAVLAASSQVELADPIFGKPWRSGIWMAPEDPEILTLNAEASRLADPVLEAGGAIEGDMELVSARERVNEIGAELNGRVRAWTERTLDAGHLPVILGGDHSTPFGAIDACAERYPDMGLLHFDAHADLRPAFEGFTWSHASILHNVMDRLDRVARVLQVGIRDLGEAELQTILASDGRIQAVFDHDWARWRMDGRDVREQVRKAIAELPDDIYVTFDIDGLDPALCPNTGTPVPGGLSWHEAGLWLEMLAQSGKRVVGLDLNEVSAGPQGDPLGESWDAIVGARLLYRLIAAASN